jgi:hypothetical protein
VVCGQRSAAVRNPAVLRLLSGMLLVRLNCATLLAAGVGCALLLVARASAGPPGPPGAATGCKPGFVMREAHAGDLICVTPASKARAAAENARAPLLWTPGPFGPKTCAQGFVWREAFLGDLTCVTTATRDFVRNENATAASRHL